MFGPICSNCGAHGHTLMRCTDLVDPLKPGFHSGGMVAEDTEEMTRTSITRFPAKSAFLRPR